MTYVVSKDLVPKKHVSSSVRSAEKELCEISYMLQNGIFTVPQRPLCGTVLTVLDLCGTVLEKSAKKYFRDHLISQEQFRRGQEQFRRASSAKLLTYRGTVSFNYQNVISQHITDFAELLLRGTLAYFRKLAQFGLYNGNNTRANQSTVLSNDYSLKL
ncbi:hypothetical protein LXL04_022558 [Taraxacum kok-saghyz]